MKIYIVDKKNLYTSIHEFLDESDKANNEEDKNKSLEKLIKFIRYHPIEGGVEEMRQFLEIVKSIGEHHRRDKNFNEGIDQLLLHYKNQIKQALPNLKIFHIFKTTKRLFISYYKASLSRFQMRFIA